MFIYYVSTMNSADYVIFERGKRGRRVVSLISVRQRLRGSSAAARMAISQTLIQLHNGLNPPPTGNRQAFFFGINNTRRISIELVNDSFFSFVFKDSFSCKDVDKK